MCRNIRAILSLTLALLLAMLAAAQTSAAAEPKNAGAILTPKPPNQPQINGPKICGVRPGKPFFSAFRPPASGRCGSRLKGCRMGWSSIRRPASSRGEFGAAKRRPIASRSLPKTTSGKAERELRIVVGDTLALTPPMGWNNWYTHYDRVTEAEFAPRPTPWSPRAWPTSATST